MFRQSFRVQPVILYTTVLLLTVVNTGTSVARTSVAETESDLLLKGREWRQKAGIPYASWKLATELGQLDASQGMLEKRMIDCTLARDLVFPDAIANLPQSQREKTGIYLMIGGYAPKRGYGAGMFQAIADHLSEQDWRATLIPLQNYESRRRQMDRVSHFLEAELPEVEQAILIGFSVGAGVWCDWLRERAMELPELERKKIVCAVFGAGVFRGSVAADWLVNASGFKVRMARRKILKLNDGDRRVFDIISEAVDDTFSDASSGGLNANPKALQVINIVTLPEIGSGLPKRDARIRELAEVVHEDWQWFGPFDGLVETGAQVLPPWDTTPQHFIRIRGSHGMIDGYYWSGPAVSSRYNGSVEAQVTAATELVDCILRAAPTELLGQR